MSYAINAARTGWRAVSSADDLLPGEEFSEVEPVLSPTYSQELKALNTVYSADRLELCQAWLVAAVADGTTEVARKADVERELAELDAQHSADIDELKKRYEVS